MHHDTGHRHNCLSDADLVGVLPGRSQDSVRVLIPDANAGASGFHDVTLVDMADAAKAHTAIIEYVFPCMLDANNQSGPYAGGCRSTPPETAGIDFHSGFRKNCQGGGVQIEILKIQV